jgi:photosystem II stability/assembly factor-like uncharacterized protein
MRSRNQRYVQKLLSALTALALAGGPAVAFAAEEHDKDDANARREARDAWYNESYGEDRESKLKKLKKRGGPWSLEFRRFMNEAARKERETYASQLPGTGSTVQSTPDGTATATATGSAWVNIGPTEARYAQNGGTNLNKTDAGRVRNILVDPTNAAVLYAAFSGGGVWKSTNGGTTWAPITEALGSLSVGALEMDRANPNTLYLGLGDPFDGTGVGLVKSTDGGATWMAPVYLGSATSITDIELVSSTVLLATTNQGVFRSTDAGASWSAVTLATGFSTAPSAWSIAKTGASSYVVALEADTAATGGNTAGQIWRTADGGLTWARATGVAATGGVERMTVASAPSAPATVYALASKPDGQLADLFKSTNGGASFTALSAAGKRYRNGNTESRTVGTLFNGQGWYDQLLAVHPTNPNLVFFGGALHIGKTTDGGGTYSLVSNWLAQYSLPYVHADMHTATFSQDGKLYVGSDGGIFVSADGGVTWSDALNKGIASHLIYDVGSSDNNPSAAIIGLQDNGTRVREGSTTIYNQEIGGDGFDCDVNPVNAKLMLGSLYYTRIQKSTDGGLNFTSACSGITECGNSSTAPFSTKLARWDGDATGNTLFTFSNTKVYKTVNYATSWTALGVTGLPSGIFLRNVGVAKSNVNVLGLVASGGRAFLSSNGGASWAQVAALPNNGLSLSDIAFDPANPNTVYVASVAPDGTKSHLWKSTNFGASWTVIENGLPAGVPVNQVTFAPGSSTTLFAATHLGVYQSLDAGASWTRWGTGMPLVEVTDIEFLPQSNRVRAATFGRSVWEAVP